MRATRHQLFSLCCLVFLFASCGNENKTPDQALSSPVPEPEPIELHYGFNLDEFQVEEGKIASGDVLSKVLQPLGVSALQIDQLIKSSEGVFDVRKIKAGQKWIALFEGDSVPSHFIYEKNTRDYVVYSFNDSIEARADQKPVEVALNSTQGAILSSLYQTLDDQSAPTELALLLSNIYAWTIDFYRLQEGDRYEILYEEDMIDGEAFGSPRIIACKFTHRDKERKAYRYFLDSTWNYFDEEGASLRKTFLKAPVEFSRISSRFTKKRFHPVLKRYKSHLGTDYAAPHGTPIVAVGDGVVTKSSYTSGNGKYVKIRHNGTYETQYLHMSKRAVNVGDNVTQGQVIGYVGSTGLATGPHVCFRFWKNGQQVDHFNEEFPPSDPISEAQMPAYNERMQFLESQLDSALRTLPQPVDSISTTL